MVDLDTPSPGGPTGLTPVAWAHSFSDSPILSSDVQGWSSAMLRHWRGTSPDMTQPPLDQHYVVLHLGGAKRVHRRSPAASTTVDVAAGSLTLVAAGTAYDWRTEGPVEFAHLYLRPDYLAGVAAELNVPMPAQATLADRIGVRSERLETLFRLMLQEVAAPRLASAFLMDVLLHDLAADLARHHLSVAARRVRHAMAPHRLRRVLDHIEENYGANLRLADLATLAGTSPYHFSRAFRHETGAPPYRYLTARRIHHARAMLAETTLPLAEIAARCGFNSPRQFAIAFRQHAGASPSAFRHAS